MRQVLALALLITFGLGGPALTIVPGWAPRVTHAEEPPVVTGTWIGTWWMGKYEEPVELAMTQTRDAIAGHITLWGYPRAGVTSAAAPIRTPVSGTIEGRRVRLTWTLPEQGAFSAQLDLIAPRRLFGAGGIDTLTTGFGLSQSE
jgi:hypothetical protein